MSIEVNASVTTRGTPDAVFAEAAGKVENLARFFTGYGGVIPGIREARLEGDGVMRAGALAVKRIVPPSEVNFTALSKRLATACSSMSRSPTISSFSGQEVCSCWPRSSASAP